MSARTRGIENRIMIGIDGQLQEGSFIKVKDFKATHRGEIVEDDYAGELETDLDIRHDGWDVSFSIDEQDAKAVDLMQTIVDRERQHTRHPNVVLTHLKTFREAGNPPITIIYRQGIIRMTDEGFGSRKERYTYSFECKFKRREKRNG